MWTSSLNIPVYSSTGPHVFMIFKTGMLDTKERNIGFAARVNFLAQRTTWETKPDTEFCGPLIHMTTVATVTEIVYNTPTPNLPVQCTYTVHIADHQVMIIASNAGGLGSQYELRDYPFANEGQKLTPYKIRNVTTVFHENMTVYSYNLSTAAYGYRLVLRPNFTEAGQRVIAVSSQSNVLGDNVFKFVEEMEPAPDMGFKYCPYSSSQALCGTKCCKDIDGKELNSTCVAHASGGVGSSAQCNTGNHCYNIQIDRCDGFIDCEDHSDEIGCFPEITTLSDDAPEQATVLPENNTAHDNTSISGENIPRKSNKGWIAACVLLPLIVIAVIVVFIVYALRRRRQGQALLRCICCPADGGYHAPPPSPPNDEWIPIPLN